MFPAKIHRLRARFRFLQYPDNLLSPCVAVSYHAASWPCVLSTGELNFQLALLSGDGSPHPDKTREHAFEFPLAKRKRIDNFGTEKL